VGIWERITSLWSPRETVGAAAIEPRQLEQGVNRSPKSITKRVIDPEALAFQITRIGGHLTPQRVSAILRAADHGDIYELVALGNECRQKDFDLQAALAAREDGVSGLPYVICEPENATPKEVEATELVRAALTKLDALAGSSPGSLSISGLVAHLQSANFFGFAAAETRWAWSGGYLLPTQIWPIAHSRFRFRQSDGRLVQQDAINPEAAIDLVADYPLGKFIQHQPRMTGDVACREGLIRVLVWAALFRNWTLKDWLVLAEIGWKPWRKGIYKKGAVKEEIDAIVADLERFSSSNVLVHSEDVDIQTGTSAPGNGSGKSQHRELHSYIGRGIFKVVLGSADAIEEGENGARAATETRNEKFEAKLELDASRNSQTLSAQLVAAIVLYNYGSSVRPPTLELQTQDAVDIEMLSRAVLNFRKASLPLSRSWIYDQVGGGKPIDEEDALTADAADDTSAAASSDQTAA
jgi:phage gp29-like protein